MTPLPGCAAVLLVACCAALGAMAQTVYRCGEGGRTVYQSEPCSGGRAVDVSDPRTDEQRRAAQEATASNARLAGQLERDRQAREAAAARANSVVVVPVAPALSAPYVVTGRRVYGRGVRHFPDGTPVPPVYRAPPGPVRRTPESINPAHKSR